MKKTFSTAFERLALTGCYVPKGVDKKNVVKSVSKLLKLLTNSETPMAIQELSVLFSTNLALMKKILKRNLNIFKNFYNIETPDNKVAVMRIDCKFRQDPMLFLALIIGSMRFSGYTEDFVLIRNAPRSKNMVRITWPKNLHEEHRILYKVCRGPIENYPDIVAFLGINYASGYDPVLNGYRASRLLPAIFFLLSDLYNTTFKLMIDRTKIKSTNNNSEARNEKPILEGSKKDVL